MHDTSNVEMIEFNPRYLPAYVELNLEWIQTYFKVEAMDRIQLEDPHQHILNVGGEIFFVLENGKAVGTCAMIPHGERCYELAKMAVAPSTRGKGYGDLLMRTALDWARTKGATRVLLLSNTILEPAINLYKKHGFQILHLGPHPDYERCNIEMEIQIQG